MYARVTRTKSAPAAIDEEVRWFEESVLPRAESAAGFLGALDLFDRDTGDGITITLWETAETRDASEGMAAGMRSEAESLEAEILSVERYEVTTYRALVPAR
jgi:hypothetical protein